MDKKLQQLFWCGILSVSIYSQTALPAPLYRITDIGPVNEVVDDNNRVSGLGVNNNGDVTGSLVLADGTVQAFIWSNGNFTYLDGLVNNNPSSGLSINNLGVVAGGSSLDSAGDHDRAVVWDGGLTPMNLGVLPDHVMSGALDINDDGVIVGYSRSHFGTDNITRAFVWNSIDGIQELPTYGGTHAQANAINAHGQITGAMNFFFHGQSHVFIGDINGVVDLGMPLDHINAYAYGINDHGVVTGRATHPDHAGGQVKNQVFVGDVNHGLEMIGALGHHPLGHIYASGNAINNDGWVVGRSTTPVASGLHAFLWHLEEGMLDLNDLIVDLTGWQYLKNAIDISNTGYITGYGIRADGSQHAFLLTEIEPTDIVLDNNDDCVGPVAEWIPINYDILFFIPGPGQKWQVASDISDQYGLDHYILSGEDNDGDTEFQWSFTVPYSGVHSVEAWWPTDTLATTQANYVVTNEAGETIVTVQQNSNGGQWNSLGNFDFLEGRTYYVRLSAPEGEPVMADAIRIRD